jgi:putative ABC transport system permease protein
MQMLAESLVLALVGGALGLLLAYLAIPVAQAVSAGSIPRVADVTIDRTVLFFVLAASVSTSTVFGLAPALRLSRTGTAAVLKQGGRTSAGLAGRGLRSALLVGEVALSLMLLVGGVLLLRSFANLTRVDPGFDAERVLAFQVSLPAASYQDSAQVQQYYDRLLSGLATAPAVSSASAVQTLPMRGSYVLSVTIQGQPPLPPGEGHSANYRAVTPDYFSTLRIPVLGGRTFSTQDSTTSPPVAIVDETFVQRHYPGEEAVGRRINIGNGTQGAEIVGVVGSVNYSGLHESPAPTMYMPMTQDGFLTVWVMVRTNDDLAFLTSTVREVVNSLDPAVPAYAVTPLAVVMDESVAQRRFSLLLVLLFGLVALFLAAVGLYGVVSYTVSQRTREIGLRMAIGARSRDVLTLIVGGGMKLALLGVAIGVPGALAGSLVVESMLFGVDRTDPASYAVTAALLLVITAVACYIPARRALQVDPTVTLQE